MPGSKALIHFDGMLRLAETLMELERQYNNPPRADEQKAVEGLRGGAAVLMVAAFEEFLKKTFGEHLSKLHTPLISKTIHFDNLPENMRVTGVFITLKNALDGPEFVSTRRIDRLADIKRAAELIAAGLLDSKAFISTKGNPGPDTVKTLFKDIGIADIFIKARPAFDRKWQRPESSTFLSDKLNEIVQRRHKVAHTASALDIGRLDLREGIRFLKILAEILDKELDKQVSEIIGTT
jgi:hypothetical protein